MYACGSYVHKKCSNYALINLLFSLCKLIWIINMLITHRSPHDPKAPTHPSYPKRITSYGTCFNSLFFLYFQVGIRIWVFQEIWRCIIMHPPICTCISPCLVADPWKFVIKCWLFLLNNLWEYPSFKLRLKECLMCLMYDNHVALLLTSGKFWLDHQYGKN